MIERTYQWTVEDEAFGEASYLSNHDLSSCYCCQFCMRVWASCIIDDNSKKGKLVLSKPCQDCGSGAILSEDRPGWWAPDLYMYPREVLARELLRMTEGIE